jgi:hypothetical protein
MTTWRENIRFLGKRGYDVLNLIELRRRGPDEKLVNKIKVGNHEYIDNE